MSKPQNTKTKQSQDANPICDILASKNRRILTVSPEEFEFIQKLRENPPAPTQGLIRAMREYDESDFE